MLHPARKLHRLFHRGFLADSPDFIQEKQHDGRYILTPRIHHTAIRVPPIPPLHISRVLLWIPEDFVIQIPGMSDVKTIGRDMGVTVIEHDFLDPPPNIDDFQLIIWLMAGLSDPPWWYRLEEGTWRGRIHLSAEFGPTWNATIGYVNSKTHLHGMFVNSDQSGPFACQGELSFATWIDHWEPHPLAEGTVYLIHADTASVSGGSPVYWDPTLGLPMMCQKKVGMVDWVISGDSNHLSDYCPGTGILNTRFVQNLINLPI